MVLVGVVPKETIVQKETKVLIFFLQKYKNELMLSLPGINSLS